MQQYAIDALAREVRVVLDRNGVSIQLLPVNDNDTLTQDEIIKSKIADAARIVESSAPLHLTGAGASLNGRAIKFYPIGSETYKADITLPTDMMRLQAVNMSGWSRPATIIMEQDALYPMQSCKWGGVRGNAERPIAAIVTRQDGLHLELYSLNKLSTDLSACSYIPYPKIEDNKINLCENLKSAIVYMAAYLTCVSLGDNTTGASLLATAQELAGTQQTEPIESTTNQIE